MLHCPSSTTPELDARLVLSAPPIFIVLHEVSSLFSSPELEFVVPSTFTSVILIAWKSDLPRLSEGCRTGSGNSEQSLRYPGEVGNPEFY